jgi:hypothetical protein
MRKILFLVTLVTLFSVSALAGAPFTKAWARLYDAGSGANDNPVSMTVDPSGNVYTLSYSIISLQRWWYVHKFDQYGKPVWTHSTYFSNGSTPRGITADAAGNVYVCGDTLDNLPADYNAMLYCLNPNGFAKWITPWNSASKKVDAAWDVVLDNLGNPQILVSSVDTQGATHMLTNLYGAGTGGLTQSIPSIKVQYFGHVVGPGPIFAVSGTNQTGGAFAELDISGAYAFGEQAQSTFVNQVETYHRYNLGFDPMGNLFVAQNKTVVSPNSTSDSTYLRCFDPNGQVLWSTPSVSGGIGSPSGSAAGTCYYEHFDSGTITLIAYSLNPNAENWTVPNAPGGGLYADGSSGVFVVGRATNGSIHGILSQKYDTKGNVSWSDSYFAPNGGKAGAAMVVARSGQLYVFGSADNGNGGTDLYLVKYLEGLTLSALNAASVTATGPNTIQATAILSGPSNSSNLKVSLSSSDPSAVGVPDFVTVPQGANLVNFNCVCNTVDSPHFVRVTATYNGCARSVSIKVNPYPLTLVSLSAVSVKGGNPLNGSVTLGGNTANSGLFVKLISDHPNALAVPASVYVAPNSATGPFKATTKPVAANTVVTVTASLNGVTKTATTTVTP